MAMAEQPAVDQVFFEHCKGSSAAMSDNRRLRSVKKVDYSELSDIKLPREKKAKVAKEADRD